MAIGGGADDLFFTMCSFARDGLLDPSARGGKLLSGSVKVGYGEVGRGVWEFDHEGNSSAKARIFGVDIGGLAEDQAIAKVAGRGDEGGDFGLRRFGLLNGDDVISSSSQTLEVLVEGLLDIVGCNGEGFWGHFVQALGFELVDGFPWTSTSAFERISEGERLVIFPLVL